MRPNSDLDCSGEGTMTVQDPVCGRRFDLMASVANLEHGGWAYFFCSHSCCRAFRLDPARYASGTPKRSGVAETSDA